MFGLVVLTFIAIYLIVSVVVFKTAMRWARNTGRGVKRWGFVAFLAMYLPVFWDHLPTILLHRYLCATEQGFWVYKTVEQWQQENPGVAATLSARDSYSESNAPGVSRSYGLNQRFSLEVLEAQPAALLPVTKAEYQVIDLANREVMARYVSVGSGYGNLAIGGKGTWKIWLNMPTCSDSREQFMDYRRNIKSQGEKK